MRKLAPVFFFLLTSCGPPEPVHRDENNLLIELTAVDQTSFEVQNDGYAVPYGAFRIILQMTRPAAAAPWNGEARNHRSWDWFFAAVDIGTAADPSKYGSRNVRFEMDNSADASWEQDNTPGSISRPDPGIWEDTLDAAPGGRTWTHARSERLRIDCDDSNELMWTISGEESEDTIRMRVRTAGMGSNYAQVRMRRSGIIANPPSGTFPYVYLTSDWVDEAQFWCWTDGRLDDRTYWDR